MGLEWYMTENTALDQHSPYLAGNASADILASSYYNPVTFQWLLHGSPIITTPTGFAKKLISRHFRGSLEPNLIWNFKKARLYHYTVAWFEVVVSGTYW